MVGLFDSESTSPAPRPRRDPRELRRVIRSVRRRWRLKVALRGLAVVIGAGLVAFAASAWGLDQFRYSEGAVSAFRVLAWTAFGALLLRFLVLPLSVRLPDERVALYIEEHDPELQAALLSAIELDPQGRPRPDLSPALVDRVIDTAFERCREVDYGRLVEGRALQRGSGVLAAVAAAGMAAVLLSPAFLRQAAPFLLMPWDLGAADNPYSIQVEPGNGAVARGSDQVITAHLVGFDSADVELAVQSGDGGEWRRLPMTADPEAGAFRFVLLDLAERTEYFVEAAGVRSDLFRLDVEEVPYVDRIDLEYHFPEYTGLSPQTVEDGGDVAALRGTNVALHITPTVAVPHGSLVIEGEEPQPLTLAEDGSLRAELLIEKEGFYHIELPGMGGALVAASPDYAIEVLTDQPPAVSFNKPGRDTQATPVEEIFTEVEAEDDYGVARLELVYSVNGSEEQVQVLSRPRSARTEVSAGHTFFLEELELQPGDFISYYARALDNRRAPGAQRATTDIYFLQVRPFDRAYRQAQQGGGGGGGGGAGGTLSEQQRQIVAATFRLQRDRARVPRREFEEDVATVALIQGRLRDQVERLHGRMLNRGVLGPGSEFASTAESLGAALAEMEAAVTELEERDVAEALGPEQRALQQLQRAEAEFGDVQVSFGGGGGGGGGGGDLNAEDLADLFELELDKLENQYETVQRSEQRQADEGVDEALQRLQELARRQEQENERMRRTGRAGQTGGSAGSQRELADQAEELSRRLERLARQTANQSLEDTARRLKEAADAMRRAGAAGEKGGLSDGISALDRLRDARRLLDDQRADRMQRDMQDAVDRAEALQRDQQRIADDVAGMGRTGGADGEQIRRLDERKDALAEEVAALEEHLDRMSAESRRSAKEASRQLDQAADGIRDSKLKEKIRYSKGVVRQRLGEVADRFEEEIGQDIDSLAESVRGASRAMGEAGDDPQAAALEQARDLVRRVESINERVQEGSPSPGRGESSSQGESGQSGQSGGEGQSGQQGEGGQAGQSGEPGQAGQAGGPGGPGGGGGRLGGPGSLGWGFRPGVFTEAEARQLRREFRERAEEAGELANRLAENGGVPADLREIVRKLRQLEGDAAWGDPKGVAELAAAALEDLKLFEYALRRELEGTDPDKLRLSGSDEVPDGWRALVEEYYRALAREGS